MKLRCKWKPEIASSNYYWISGEGLKRCLMPESGRCPYCGKPVEVSK